MEAACPQAVSESLANPDGLRAPASIHAIFLGASHAHCAAITREEKSAL
jgi:hypothetical protein